MTAPDCRTLTIEAEDRTLTVPAEGTGSTIAVTVDKPMYWGASYWGGSYWGGSYWYTVAGSIVVTGTPTERTLTVETEDRTLEIEAEDRTMVIGCP